MGNGVSSIVESSDFFSEFSKVEPSKYETSTEKRDRTLKHLLRANHHNFSILYSVHNFHNHLPHALGSAYLLGAPAEHLQAVYEHSIKDLEPWKDSPHEISSHDWRDCLGETQFQRAYVDFFEDELVKMGYDWRKVVGEYMLEGENPLICGGIGGLGHPLIHLGYAFELDNREVAMEALTEAATNYNFLHKYIDAPFPQASSSGNSFDPVEILSRIHNDKRFDNRFNSPGAGNIERLFETNEAAVLEYFHELQIPADDITSVYRVLSKAAALLLCTTSENCQYDFFMCHLVTTAYAVRTILPEMPVSFAPQLLRSHWLFVIIVYCIQLRPKIVPARIDHVDLAGKTWDDVVAKGLHQKQGEEIEDTHYLKVLRTFKESAKLFPDEDLFYLKAAVKFAWEFDTWSGFGEMQFRQD